jgi:hypothetical protein
VTALAAALAVVALCKPQLAYLPVAVVLVHCYRRDRLAAIVGAGTAAAGLVVLAHLATPGAHWGEWLTAMRDQPAGPGWQVWLALLIGGIAGIVLTVRAARRCRSSFEGWLLLAASGNGLGAAVVRWNPQWHVVLVLPVLALLVLGDPPAWSRRDQAALALLGALRLPDAMTSATYNWGLPYAVIPLAMSATVLVAVALARLVPAAWGGRSLAAGCCHGSVPDWSGAGMAELRSRPAWPWRRRLSGRR